MVCSAKCWAENTLGFHLWTQVGLGSLGQVCLNRCTIRLSLMKCESKCPDGGLLSTQQLPQSTTSLIFSYHRPFVVISNTEAEICSSSVSHPLLNSLAQIVSCGGNINKPWFSEQCWSWTLRAFQTFSGLGTSFFQLPTHWDVSFVVLGGDWPRAVCPSLGNARRKHRWLCHPELPSQLPLSELCKTAGWGWASRPLCVVAAQSQGNSRWLHVVGFVPKGQPGDLLAKKSLIEHSGVEWC